MQSVLANHTTGHGSDPGLFQLGLAIGGLAVIAGGIYYKINA